MLTSFNICSTYHTQNTPLRIGAVPTLCVETGKPPMPRVFCVMEKELWLPVVGYEGYYEVSNHGNVRSLGRYINHPKGMGYNRASFGRILSTTVNHKRRGYIYVSLKVNGVHKSFSVHRLVAMAFLNNPNNLPEVNHKDFNTQNNRVENLEWCSRIDNVQHSIKAGRKPKQEKNKRWKTVYAYTKDGQFVGEYDSIRKAGDALGVFGQNICSILKGTHKYIKGYTFTLNKRA